MYYGEIRSNPVRHMLASLLNPTYRAWLRRCREKEELRLRLLSNCIITIKR